MEVVQSAVALNAVLLVIKFSQHEASTLLSFIFLGSSSFHTSEGT
jgi:hypothetical protein